MAKTEVTNYIKLVGEKYAYAALNVIDSQDWIEFDRVNSKTGEISGHLKVNKSQIISIEQRQALL